MIQLHDIHTINNIDWDSKRDGEYVKNYFTPILQYGINHYIKNVNTSVYLLEIDDLVIPVTVNEKEFENSYVCSPYTHYISYAKEELWELKKPLLEKVLSKCIDGIGFFLRHTRINRVVIINNWFLSTNLYFPLSESQIERITKFLSIKFPTYTLMFRSLNKRLHQQMFHGFKNNKYKQIMSRSIYLFEPLHFKSLSRRQKKDFLNDESFMKKSNYSVSESTKADESFIPVIEQLYNQLYIHKYSEHNPQFTTEYYSNAIKHDLMNFKILQNEDDSIDGVIGYFHRNNVLTTPILGYKLDKGKSQGLYRLLSLLIAYEVLDKNYIGHFSAGAGDFKRNRGSIQEIEYTFYYNEHLSFTSKFVWNFLKLVMDKVVEPMAIKMEF
ncbi:hypothetical protein [Neobacillus sp.]|uniref:hypothetical protein n=1 Tax=Neobacillus sp. TaxID=2675273 RepID=UPI002898EF5A|nr:hypothetical protein [Neobacillus sp.]